MKRVAVIGTVGIPACYGGFETLVENIVLNSSNNIRYEVFCSSSAYSKKEPSYNNVKLTYIPIKANGIQSVFYDIFSLLLCVIKKPDTVLILGVSGCIFLPFFKLLSRSRVVTNIDGLEWKRDKWSSLARKFLKLSEKLAVKYSDVIITDNQAIGDYVAEEYQVNSKTIAYGGDHVITGDLAGVKKEDYYLTICRIEPENNVDMILKTFERSGKLLKFVGNWNNSVYGRNLKMKYSMIGNIQLLDPIYDLTELFQLRARCAGYVHGHSAGGTNPSLVEAMQFSMPIYAFDCSFNRYTTGDKAFYFKDANDLYESILEGLEKRENLLAMAEEMKKIASQKYTWDIISSSYEATY